MSRDELIKKFSDYVYYFNAYCTSDTEDHEMLKAVLALLKEQEHKDKMFHTLEEDWKRLKAILKEQKKRIETLESLRRIEQEGR